MKRFDIVGNRKWYFTVSILLVLAGIIVMLVSQVRYGAPLNLGTDFEAGTRVQVQLGPDFKEDDVRKIFTDNKLDPHEITRAGNAGEVAVIRLPEKISPVQESAIIKGIKAKYANSQDPEVVSVDPVVAREMSKKAIWAVIGAAVGIILYMSIRFEYRFAISGVISLLQVVLLVVSIFALLRIEIDLPFIAALLTIVGYSIHDTIVIFDRIRENLRLTKVKTVKELEILVNDSLWHTMNRSINTILTVIFAAGMLYVLGGQSIKNFSLALLIGLVIGGYSSIFIASQMWVSWRERSLKAEKQS